MNEWTRVLDPALFVLDAVDMFLENINPFPLFQIPFLCQTKNIKTRNKKREEKAYPPPSPLPPKYCFTTTCGDSDLNFLSIFSSQSVDEAGVVWKVASVYKLMVLRYLLPEASVFE